ncbi:MAG: class I SAM-dependent methyltransferase [Actinomycetota bacterium]|nr:class I SAM-dependent methyltransferase [Actinomycetota bacterium]
MSTTPANAPLPNPTAPNHHADLPGFSGIGGLLAGLTMLLGGRADARLVADVTSIGEGDHVVDIGCGPGNAAREAARRGATVTGVDPAGVMLSIARRVGRDRARITWREGTAEALPLTDEAATVVWSLGAVHHWTELDAGLAEVHRVLAPGGRFVAGERRTAPGARGLASHGWTPAQTEAFVERCRAYGFTDVASAHHGDRVLVTAHRPAA